MIFSIENTAGWCDLDDKYKKILKPFSLKTTIKDNGRKLTTIEINNMQELMDIVNKTDEELIIRNKLDVDGNVMLEIYDTWRE